MTTREKKTTTTKDTNNEVIAKTKENKETIKIEENSNSNDMFSPENMSKMFAMFQQFQAMTNANKPSDDSKEQNKQETGSTKIKKFSKVQLGQIGDEIVMLRSVVDNVTFMSPKTQIEYTWSNKGDVEPVTVSEVLTIENVSKRFLHTPWLVTEDERIIEALSLKNTYDLIENVENVEELVQLSKEEIERIFIQLPKEYQNNFRNEIYKKVKTRELNNLKTIDDLAKILKIDFNI